MVVKESPTVAQSIEEKGVILQVENNPHDYKYMINKLLYYSITTWGFSTPKQLEKFFIQLNKTGLLSPHTLAIYFYLYTNKAATRQKIAEDLETAEQTVYKNINKLVKYGLVKRTGKIKAPRFGGHKPMVYAVFDAKPDEIANAKLLEQQRRIPGFQLVKEISQYMIEDFIPRSDNPNEVSMRQITWCCNRYNLKNLSKKAIYDMVAHNVQRSGVRVWR